MLAILDALRDKALSSQWFRNPTAWRAWFAFLAALFCLPMDAEAPALYRKHTRRTKIARSTD